MNIGTLGIGGVGGCFGGLLAEHYSESPEVNVIFIARHGTAAIIRQNGLKLITPAGEKIIRPYKTATNAQEAGALDVLICATKSYDLEEGLKPLSDCITPETLILPLLNGVNAKNMIQGLYPAANVLDGCVYVNAERVSPGVIKKTGSLEKLYFGSTSLPLERLEPLQQVFQAAGIDSYLSDNIETDIWTKYIFTAGMATSTSYFDQSLGEVLLDPEHRFILHSLVREAYSVAIANGIQLPGDMIEATLKKYEAFPFESTSSMHRDFQKGGKTEYRSLTKYIADLGDSIGIDTPVFDGVIPGLAGREQLSY